MHNLMRRQDEQRVEASWLSAQPWTKYIYNTKNNNFDGKQ